MANIKDVAKRAGVAISTVSKYINGGSVREYNAEAIQEAIDALDFKINDIARSLKTNKAMTVGILIPSLEAAFFTSIASLMEDKFQEEGYDIILCDYRNNPNLEKDKLDFLISKRVDGLVIVPRNSEKYLGKEFMQNVPVVSIDRPIEGIDSVLSDSCLGSKQAIDHLLQNGHEKIAIISGPDDIYTTRLRLEGYVNSLETRGIVPREEYIRAGNYTLSGGYTQMCELLSLKERPTAVFVANYEMTMGAILALNEKGVSIPDDVSLIGFDDMDMVHIINPPLTVVTQPLELISQKAASLLLDRMKNNSTKQSVRLELETELIVRSSVKDIS